jgi:hypothetical protein
MQRYKAFARQLQLPAIRANNNTLLEVGETAKADVAQLGDLSATEKEKLGKEFEVPVAVINKLVRRAATASPSSQDQFAQELRTAVIDYRFLQIEWGRYHPPAEGQQVKATALEALQVGELTKAWELYDGLRKPQAPAMAAPAPPANLRNVTPP